MSTPVPPLIPGSQPAPPLINQPSFVSPKRQQGFTNTGGVLVLLTAAVTLAFALFLPFWLFPRILPDGFHYPALMIAIPTVVFGALFFAGTAWVTAKLGFPATGSGSNHFQNGANQYRITFPEGWILVNPNDPSTKVKARAREGYAAMAVAERQGLWRDDTTSRDYTDAWAALDGISVQTFLNKFERSISTQSALVHKLDKSTLGAQKAIYVDYTLTDSAKNVRFRIRIFLILHSSRWYTISCATSESAPDLCLEPMLKAVGTFEFFDGKLAIDKSVR